MCHICEYTEGHEDAEYDRGYEDGYEDRSEEVRRRVKELLDLLDDDYLTTPEFNIAIKKVTGE